MKTTWRVTPADRDAEGKIRITPDPIRHRTLAELLPGQEGVEEHAGPPVTMRQYAAGAVVAAVAVFILVALARQPAPAAVRPQALPTAALPTLAPIPPTVAPTALPAGPTLTRAVVGYFNLDDPRTATPLDAGRAYIVVGYVDGWRLLAVGNARVWVRSSGIGEPSVAGVPNLATTVPPPPVIIQQPAVIVAPVAQPQSSAAPERVSSKHAPPTRVPVQQAR